MSLSKRVKEGGKYFVTYSFRGNYSIYQLKNCHNAETIRQFPHFLLSKKNSFRGNYTRRYGSRSSSTYYCLLLRAHTSRLHTSDVITSNTVFPHIIAAATILFWNGKTLKNSYSFHIVFSPTYVMKTWIGSFLTKVGNAGEETVWGNTVLMYNVHSKIISYIVLHIFKIEPYLLFSLKIENLFDAVDISVKWDAF